MSAFHAAEGDAGDDVFGKDEIHHEQREHREGKAEVHCTVFGLEDECSLSSVDVRGIGTALHWCRI